MESIQTLISQAADGTDIEVREYSGRAMYGKQCIAIVGEMSQMLCLIASVIQNAHTEAFDAALHADSDEEKDDACELTGDVADVISNILDYRTDSMGLSTVLYWPGVEWVEPEMTFDLWKEGIAEMMDCSVASLVKKCEGKFNLRSAYDQKQSIEDAVEDIDCSCND